MNLEKIENDIKKLLSNLDKENFIYDFLLAYGLPKSSINRLKKGDYNKSKNDGEIIWAKKIYFKTVLENEDVHDVIDEISKTKEIEKNKIRFIIVTDFKTFLSKDIKTSDTLDIELSKLFESLNFFLPLMGRENITIDKENVADIKAANKMSKLFDVLIRDNINFYQDNKKRLELNIFFTKVLFCYFAEDSDIFELKSDYSANIAYGMLGINIGKNKDTILKNATDDYVSCLNTLHPFADYFTLNISSPNTEDLRKLQGKEALRVLLDSVCEHRDNLDQNHVRETPLLVKLSPDLDDTELENSICVIKEFSIQGVIIANTTVKRPELKSKHRFENGGADIEK